MSNLSDAVGIFPPRSTRTAETVVLCSFAVALAQKRGTIVCLFPDGAAFPLQLQKTPGVEFRSCASEKTVAATQVALPPSVEWFLSDPSRRSALCWVGFSPTMEDLHHARRLIAALTAAGVPADNVRRVLWNDGLPGALPAAAIEKYMGPPHLSLPYDPALLNEAERRALVIQSAKPRAAFSVALERWAQETREWWDHRAGTPVVATGDDKSETDLERRLTAALWSSLSGNANAEKFSAQQLSFQIDQELQRIIAASCMQLPAAALTELRRRVFDHVTGLGPLETLLRDASISEIMVNGHRSIFLERNGRIERCDRVFDSEVQLRTVIDRVVGRMGRRVDLSSPLCDVRLADGSRVNVVLPPLSLNGPVMTIRRFKPLYKSMNDLIDTNTLTTAQADQLARAVTDRDNIIVTGNSGAGKTTLLNVLTDLVPDDERIITLEDAAELQIRKPHVVKLETRARNAEGLGHISMSDLVINALRMRPDRLVIGECRGSEVVPMLQAMNTGHDGSLTTLHANSAAEALKRLESLVLLNAPEWPLAVVREQIEAGIDLLVHMKRSGGERKLVEIVRV